MVTKRSTVSDKRIGNKLVARRKGRIKVGKRNLFKRQEQISGEVIIKKVGQGIKKKNIPCCRDPRRTKGSQHKSGGGIWMERGKGWKGVAGAFSL